MIGRGRTRSALRSELCAITLDEARYNWIRAKPLSPALPQCSALRKQGTGLDGFDLEALLPSRQKQPYEHAGQTIAMYPSPAGAMESLLSFDPWDDVTGVTRRDGQAEGRQAVCPFLHPASSRSSNKAL
jgi:hypothetical protein